MNDELMRGKEARSLPFFRVFALKRLFHRARARRRSIFLKNRSRWKKMTLPKAGSAIEPLFQPVERGLRPHFVSEVNAGLRSLHRVIGQGPIFLFTCRVFTKKLRGGGRSN